MLTTIEDYSGYSRMLSRRRAQELPQHLFPSLQICFQPDILLLLLNLIIYPLLRLPASYLL